MTKIDLLWRTYESTSDLIKFADTKATAILAIDGLTMSLLFSNLSFIQDFVTQKAFLLPLFIFAIVLVLVSLAASVCCLTPRVYTKNECLLFFGNIVLLPTIADFEEKIRAAQWKDAEQWLINQIWASSQIVSKKFFATKVAVISFASAIIMSAILLLASI